VRGPPIRKKYKGQCCSVNISQGKNILEAVGSVRRAKGWVKRRFPISAARKKQRYGQVAGGLRCLRGPFSSGWGKKYSVFHLLDESRDRKKTSEKRLIPGRGHWQHESRWREGLS